MASKLLPKTVGTRFTWTGHFSAASRAGSSQPPPAPQFQHSNSLYPLASARDDCDLKRTACGDCDRHTRASHPKWGLDGCHSLPQTWFSNGCEKGDGRKEVGLTHRFETLVFCKVRRHCASSRCVSLCVSCKLCAAQTFIDTPNITPVAGPSASSRSGRSHHCHLEARKALPTLGAILN